MEPFRIRAAKVATALLGPSSGFPFGIPLNQTRPNVGIKGQKTKGKPLSLTHTHTTHTNMFLGSRSFSRSPSGAPFYPFLGEGSPTTIDYRKEGYPYSRLSTGGPTVDEQNPAPLGSHDWLKPLFTGIYRRITFKGF